MNWTEKYRPKHLREVAGNGIAKEKLLKWAEEWKNSIPQKKAVILYGKPGVGKTSAAHALAMDFGWEVVELNASDDRNRDAIRRIAMTGAVNETLGWGEKYLSSREGARRLIILDEADNLYERNGDFGGKAAIIETIKMAKQPIILIANDYYTLIKGKGNELKKLCIPIEFKKVEVREIVSLLKKLCSLEGLECDGDVLEAIARKCDGDVRSAINDLQSISYKKRITREMLHHLGYRDRKEEIFSTLRTIMRAKEMRIAINEARILDEPPDNLILWIDENMPREYRYPDDLMRAYNFLSHADIFLGRTWKRQYYGLWRYAFELMTGGVAVAKRHEYRGFTKYSFPIWLRTMAKSKAYRHVRGMVARKIGRAMHCSTKKAMEFIPFIKKLFSDSNMAPYFAANLDLNKEEIEYLLEDAEKAEEIYKAGGKLRKMKRQTALFSF